MPSHKKLTVGAERPDADGGAASDRARELGGGGNGDARLQDEARPEPQADSQVGRQAGHDDVQGDVHGDVADDRRADPRFFIVGVGASAGGLEALSALLKHIKLDDMAFVVVQHLAPKHESFLPALLARVSNIKVEVAADGTQVEPNHVYVIPPNADLAILRGVLQVMSPPQCGSGHGPGPHLPIDYFFRHLAEDLGPRSIGIVLSGTGSDGTFGLKAIKEAGGITFAQEPATAEYDGMPRSAIDAGRADFSLAPHAIRHRPPHIRPPP